MYSDHIQAVEKRIRWLRWAKTNGYYAWREIGSIANIEYTRVLPNYTKILEEGDTLFMNRNFCQLVEHARSTIPDDIQFEYEWMQTKNGFLYIETPFKVPAPVGIGKEDIQSIESIGGVTVQAIGWFTVPEGIKLKSLDKLAPPGTIYVCTFQDFEHYKSNSIGFGCWSYFTLQPGDILIDRVRQFEQLSARDSINGVRGAYRTDRTSDMMHEIRWTYAALHLMSQRLAHHSQKHLNRQERKRLTPNTPPFVRIISLRRLEEDRENNQQPSTVEWNWQWEVRGHWRNQWYPSEKTWKQIFIEAYVKGPEDKPLKPPGHKLFVANR